MLTARTKTIEKTGTGRQFPPSLASLSATKFSLQIYMELTAQNIQDGGHKVNLVPRLPQGCHKVATRLPQGCHKVATRLPQGCHKVATRLPQGCHKVATRLPQGCHKVATRLSLVDTRLTQG